MSQTTDILKHLLKGNRLTDLQCRKLFNCTRLAARISDIEKIIGRKPDRKYIYKNDKKFMQYWIDKPKK